MNKLKYILSIIIIVCITILVLLFPGEYFSNYVYLKTVGDMKAEEYASIERSNATASQVLNMLNNGNYTEKKKYDVNIQEEAESNQDENYRTMVKEAFELFSKENSFYDQSIAEILIGYMKDWNGEMDNWYVQQVSEINAAGMFYKQMAYAKLYDIQLYSKEDAGRIITIRLNDDTKVFYELTITDERYPFENIVEYEMKFVIDDYFIRTEKNSSELTYNGNTESSYLQVDVVTAPGTVRISNQ